MSGLPMGPLGTYLALSGIELRMFRGPRILRAIDLYAGVGGWSLGLRLAGIEVVASYEWWLPAVDTHNANHDGAAEPVDIRKLDLASLPRDIGLVVGSPPCTQFSFSNRGGSGDQADGLKDLVRFFEVVELLQPRYWVMENVPRVAEVLRQGLSDPDHPLYRFRDLAPTIKIYDMSEFGVPQARRRCIAGNIPFDLLESYAIGLDRPTLGDVVKALASSTPKDPVWGVALDRSALTEMEKEAPLNPEELRMNREAKLFHPVYNNMSFPDDMGSPARTVTATCTRVSRESIVIADPEAAGEFRRLTVRERAALQGFPITYQFYGRSFAEKAKMAGNAIPPPFTYLVACAAKGVPAVARPTFKEAGAMLTLPQRQSQTTRPDREGQTYPASRRFRAAIPGLRLKSGMRFELSNTGQGDDLVWDVRFMFGPSRDIREITLDDDIRAELLSAPLVARALIASAAAFAAAEQTLWRTDPARLQQAWAHRSEGVGPYELVDLLGELAVEIRRQMETMSDAEQTAAAYVLAVAAENDPDGSTPGARKLAANGLTILSGLVVGSWFNTLPWHGERREAA